MKKKNAGCLVVVLLIILLVVGIAVGRSLWEKSQLRNTSRVDCPVFDTRTYLAGTELEGRDLTALLSEGLSPVSDIRYGEWQLGSVRFTDPEAEGYPAPFAVLLKTVDDEQPVFCKPAGVEIADVLSEANTLIYVVQTGPFHSGSFYCHYKPYVFTLSGEYCLPCETVQSFTCSTVQDGLVRSVECFGLADPGSANPLEQYVRNFKRIRSFDFMNVIDSSVPASDEAAIEYRIRETDDDFDYTDWREIPCYDLTEESWGNGEIELNGEPPLYIMTSEVTGNTPIQGSYATIGTAYIQTLKIRIYDCDTRTYIEFPWQDSTAARPQVSNSVIASYPPPVYYRVR